MTTALTYVQYREGLGRGVLLGLRCEACGQIVAPPTATCPSCGSTALKRTELAPRGTITTFTVVRVAAAGVRPPIVVAMAELDQGPWLMGTVKGLAPEDATMALIGRRVTVGSEPAAADPYSGGEGVSLVFGLEDGR
jgi:uncharacterized OB-fold protein